MMKKSIFLFALMQFAFFVESNCQLTNGIVAFWKFDDTSLYNVYDEIGNTTGTLFGTSSSPTGIIDNSRLFNGSDDYIVVPNTSALNIQGNAISLSAWIKPEITGKTQMIVSKIHHIGTHVSPYFQYNLQLYYGSSKMYPRFLLSVGGIVKMAANSAYSLTVNEWYHIVGTYDGTTMRLFLDGTQIASSPVTGNISGYETPIYFGINGVQGEAYGGNIDEVGIWNRVLNETEVDSLFNNGSGLTYPFGENVAVTGVSVTPNPGTISVGGTLQLTANITPVNATDKTITWTNQSNPAWFSINSSGLVTAIGPAGSEGTFGAYAHNGVSGITNITITAGTPPTVTTTSPSGIAQNSATSGGNVTSAGSSSVTARGVCWSTSANPNITLSTKTTNGTGTGSFTSSITGLSANTTYHIRAYATSSVGTSYGSDVTFLTSPTTPTVTTTTPSSISQTTATCGGNVTSNGGATLTARGVCWSTSANPTVTLSTKTTDGTATGTFASSITGLNAQTTYHVRAYATNSVGTTYGNDITFTTSGAPGTWQSNGSNIYYAVTGGKVGIGTATPTSALTVNGKILATEVEVVSSIASDYVFEPEYQLMPLTELEIYLKQHKHLPGIPSALEFRKQGQNLGEMQDMLLRKIEEITLYLIELRKENEKLKEENKEIKAILQSISIE